MALNEAEFDCRLFEFVNISRDGCVPYFDLSDQPYPSTMEPLPPWETAFKIIVYLFLIPFSFFGNIIVVCIVIFNKNMRGTTNIYIANLALGDFLMACCPMWVNLVEGITRQWNLGETICKIFPFVQVTMMCCSVFTMTAIACDRFFAVMFPLKTRSTTRNVGVIITIIWILSITLGLPMIPGYQLRQRKWNNNEESFCNEEFAWLLCEKDICEFKRLQTLYRKIYWIVVCAVANWLPMVIMQTGYLAIAVVMYRRNRMLPNHRRGSGSSKNTHCTVQERSLRKVLRMLFIVLVTFMFCWVPSQISTVYSLYRPDVEKEVKSWFLGFRYGAMVLAHANSALNPIIYAGLSENFRKGFLRFIVCWKKNEPHDRLTTQKTRSSLLAPVSSSQNQQRQGSIDGGGQHVVNRTDPSKQLCPNSRRTGERNKRIDGPEMVPLASEMNETLRMQSLYD
ncbi:QRFP-like peptide receptor [Tubulanus polymorphus]|uniref:QRFP-like peptide receptor n=1 Tax=Tubulanus polymorphus TaxID=672921 RepID=UPI003DA33952